MPTNLAVDWLDDHADLVDGLGQFIKSEVVPRHEANAERWENPTLLYDEKGRYAPDVLAAMREVREASAQAGFYNMFLPEDMGGAGLGPAAFYVVWESIFHRCGANHFLGLQVIAHWTRGPSRLLAGLPKGTSDPRFAGLLAGSTTLCFGMSEPDAGSDAWMMRTRAERDGDGWRITGVKQWISNAPYADHALIFAVTDPDAARAHQGGISAFVVRTDDPGFSVDGSIRLFGHPGSNEGVIHLDAVAATDDDVVGVVGGGLEIAMEGVSVGRLYNAAKGVGLGRWALEQAVAYVKERQTFGRPLLDRQGITFPLAESAMELHAAHLVGLNTAALLERGRPGGKEVAIAKAYATEVACRAIDRSIQAHGAMGFTNELGLAEAWQQMRVVCVADGSAEILRRQIVKHLAQGDTAL